jgi:hypothetical protein
MRIVYIYNRDASLYEKEDLVGLQYSKEEETLLQQLSSSWLDCMLHIQDTIRLGLG